MQIAETKFSVV